ncbi:hypothetical protein BHE74_00051681 [Ensete ventricosum]|nr:hypothetical protein BHE74_00051681 [Ensete ventricosum]
MEHKLSLDNESKYGGVELRDQNQGVSMDAGSERGRSCQGTTMWLRVGFEDAMAEDDRGQELEVKLVHDSFREQRLG